MWGSPGDFFLEVVIKALPLTGSLPPSETVGVSGSLFVTLGIETIILVLPSICYLVISIRTKEREGRGV